MRIEDQMQGRAMPAQPAMMGGQMPQTGAAAQMQQMGAAGGGMAGMMPRMAAKVIGQEQVRQAMVTLKKYKDGKANLERRIIANEQWYKLRHWEMLEGEKQQVEPTSAWLFNTLANKHADAMDNFPSANILPREAGDKGEATMLSSIIPVVMERNDFEDTYDSVVDDKDKNGTGVYGVFWDPGKMNGMGDISVEYVDVVNLFWEPGKRKIQDSRNVFHVVLRDNDELEEEFPECKGKLGNDTGTIAKYIQDESIDTSGKSAVVDWYYKKRGVLHYCKFVEDVVLFATENEPEKYPNGWYDDGLYPFVFDALYRVKDSPCGFGFIDIAKSAQEYIDRGNQAIMQNMMANARPRHFIRSDGSVNEEEYADYTKDFIHVEGGSLGTDSILPVTQNPLPGIYQTIIQEKIEELKEVTGNRDISTGGSQSGVTAASAIAAMQEAGSKLSRDNNKKSYRAFREVVLMVIERIRQFYDMPRRFRILGEDGMQQFVEYSNQGITEQEDYRVPLFDVEVTAQKQSPYSKMSQNELALQFYSAGFFNPQMADQALATLEMMDFDRKSFIMQRIEQNGTMMQMIQMMQQQMLGMAAQLDGGEGGPTQMALMQQFGMEVPGAAMGAPASAAGQQALGDDSGGESHVTKNARERVADSTAPR